MTVHDTNSWLVSGASHLEDIIMRAAGVATSAAAAVEQGSSRLSGNASNLPLDANDDQTNDGDTTGMSTSSNYEMRIQELLLALIKQRELTQSFEAQVTREQIRNQELQTQVMTLQLQLQAYQQQHQMLQAQAGMLDMSQRQSSVSGATSDSGQMLSPEPPLPSSAIACPICNRLYSCRSNWNKHCRQYHPGQIEIPPRHKPTRKRVVLGRRFSRQRPHPGGSLGMMHSGDDASQMTPSRSSMSDSHHLAQLEAASGHHTKQDNSDHAAAIHLTAVNLQAAMSMGATAADVSGNLMLAE